MKEKIIFLQQRGKDLLRRILPVPLKSFLKKYLLRNFIIETNEQKYDPSAQMAMSDLIHSGDTIFDVGANIGQFTIFMARLVGNSGHVYAFEPNEGSIRKLKIKLELNGINNCTIIQAAVVENGGGFIDFYLDERPGWNGVASSLSSKWTGSTHKIGVPAISLDEYCAKIGVCPNFVKIDIEGSELMALQGFKKNIENYQPHLIIEFRNEGSNSPNTSLAFLEEFGYELVDLNLFKPVTVVEYMKQPLLRNILAIHKTKKRFTPYVDISLQEVYVIDIKGLNLKGEKKEVVKTKTIVLERDRYVASCDFHATGNPELGLFFFANGKVITNSYGFYDHIKLGCQHMAFELKDPTTKVQFGVRKYSKTGTVDFDRIVINKVHLAHQSR